MATSIFQRVLDSFKQERKQEAKALGQFAKDLVKSVPAAPSLFTKTGGALERGIESITKPQQGLGESIGALAAAPQLQKTTEDINKRNEQLRKQVLQQVGDKTISVERGQKLLGNLEDVNLLADQPGLQKKPRQLLGELVDTALLAAPGTVTTKTIPRAAALGAGFGAARTMQEEAPTPFGAVQNILTGAATTAGLRAAIPAVAQRLTPKPSLTQFSGLRGPEAQAVGAIRSQAEFIQQNLDRFSPATQQMFMELRKQGGGPAIRAAGQALQTLKPVIPAMGRAAAEAVERVPEPPEFLRGPRAFAETTGRFLSPVQALGRTAIGAGLEVFRRPTEEAETLPVRSTFGRTLLGAEEVKPLGEQIFEAGQIASRLTGAERGETTLPGATVGPIALGLFAGIEATPVGKGAKAGAKAAKAVVPKVDEVIKETVGNIRLDKLGLDDVGKQQVADVIERANNFVDQRRGVKSFDDIRAAAEEIVPKIKLARGKNLNAEESVALGNAIAGYTASIDDLVKKIAAGDDSTETLLKLERLRTDQNVALASLAGNKAELGRALGAQRIVNKALSPEAKLNESLIKQALDISGGRESVENIARRFAELGDDTVGKMKFVQSLNKPKVADLIDWYWYNSLLSGPKTQIRNIVGTMNNVGFRIASKPFAAAADAFITTGKKLTKQPVQRQVLLGEMPAEIAGALKGIPEGFQKASFMFRNGFNFDGGLPLTELRAPVEAIPGTFPNVVSRSMSAADTFFKSIAASSELNALAWKSGKQAGLKGKAFANHVADFLDNPPQEAIQAAKEVASIDTFTNQTNAVIKSANKVRQNIKTNIGGKEVTIWNPVKLVVPFMKTVANVTARGLEATPVGLLTAVTRPTQRGQAQAAGKALMGTLTLMPLVSMASQGRISGQGPRDYKTRQALMKTGWRPNSIKVGDKWVNYQLLQPVNIALGAIGNIHDAYVYDKQEFDANIVVAKLGNTLLDSSFLSGLNDLLEGFSNEDLSRAFQRMGTSAAIPFSAAVRTTTQALDPAVRQAEGFKESLMATIPGLSEKLPARLDIFGEEIEREGGPLKRALDPFNVSTELPSQESEAIDLAQALEVTIPSTPRVVKLRNPETNEKVELTREQKHKYQQTLGQAMRGAIVNVMNTPEFQELDENSKRDLLEMRISEAKSTINDTFFLQEGAVDEATSLQRLRELSLEATTEEFYQDKEADDIADNLFNLIQNGQGSKAALIQQMKGLTTEQQIKDIESKIEERLYGGTKFEEFLKKQDTNTRAIFIQEKLQDMPKAEYSDFLTNLAEKKILTDATIVKMLVFMNQQ